MIKKTCPICEQNNFTMIYKSNLPNKIEAVNYAGRKKPDFYHYEMVRCLDCNVLYASSIYSDNFIEQLYKQSDFPYEDEIKGLKKTYETYLLKANNYIINKERMLDIGCGNGFMLNVGLNLGWENVVGIEPSSLAIDKVDAKLKNNIIEGIFNKNNFEENSIDLIFCAMVLEHLSDINNFLIDLKTILKPGGIVLAITHDEGHILSRILKNKHPIINDEHVCVYNRKTLEDIFLKHNFRIQETNSVKNIYSIKYWIGMLPIFPAIKNFISVILHRTKLLNINLGLKAGNIYIIAQKPYKRIKQ